MRQLLPVRIQGRHQENRSYLMRQLLSVRIQGCRRAQESGASEGASSPPCPEGPELALGSAGHPKDPQETEGSVRRAASALRLQEPLSATRRGSKKRSLTPALVSAAAPPRTTLSKDRPACEGRAPLSRRGRCGFGAGHSVRLRRGRCGFGSALPPSLGRDARRCRATTARARGARRRPGASGSGAARPTFPRSRAPALEAGTASGGPPHAAGSAEPLAYAQQPGCAGAQRAAGGCGAARPQPAVVVLVLICVLVVVIVIVAPLPSSSSSSSCSSLSSLSSSLSPPSSLSLPSVTPSSSSPLSSLPLSSTSS